jgi:hypothetical protein
MRFTVGWAPYAEKLLEKWWIDRPDSRPAITSASNRIDILLANDPHRSV